MSSLFFPKKRSLEKTNLHPPWDHIPNSPQWPSYWWLLDSSQWLWPVEHHVLGLSLACTAPSVVRWLVGWASPMTMEIGHWQPSQSPQQKKTSTRWSLAVRSVRVNRWQFPHLHHHAIYHYLPCIDSIQGPCRSSQFWPRDLLTKKWLNKKIAKSSIFHELMGYSKSFFCCPFCWIHQDLALDTSQPKLHLCAASGVEKRTCSGRKHHRNLC